MIKMCSVPDFRVHRRKSPVRSVEKSYVELCPFDNIDKDVLHRSMYCIDPGLFRSVQIGHKKCTDRYRNLRTGSVVTP